MSLLSLCLLGCGQPSAPAPPPALPKIIAGEQVSGVFSGDLAPDIEGVDLDGESFKLSDYRGKVVIMSFWGHWCTPCRLAYPHERSLVKRFKDRPFALLGVNSDLSLARLKNVRTQNDISWRSWWDGGQDGPISRKFRIDRWPSFIVIDGKGVVRYRDVDDFEILGRIIEKLLGEIEGNKS